jgi:hypothetical protein
VSELEIFLEQLYLFILSDSEKFFWRHVLICVDGDKTNSDSDIIARGRDKCPQKPL